MYAYVYVHVYVFAHAYVQVYLYVYMYLYLHLYLIYRWKGDRWLLYVMFGNSLSFDEECDYFHF